MLVLISPVCVPVSSEKASGELLNPSKRIAIPSSAGCSSALVAKSPSSQIAFDREFLYINDSGGNLFRLDKDGSAQTLLASVSGSSILSIAVDETHIYFSSGQSMPEGSTVPGSGAIFAIAKAGGPVTTLASSLDSPFKIELDETYVYFLEAGFYSEAPAPPLTRLRRIAKSSGHVDTLIEVQFASSDIALDNTHIYFSASDPYLQRASLNKISKEGGQTIKLVEDETIYNLALDEEFVYYTGDRFIRRLAKTGGAIDKTFAEGLYVKGIEVANGELYFLEGYLCFSRSTLNVLDTETDSLSLVTDQLGCANRLVIDGCAVYVASYETEFGEAAQVGIQKICRGCPPAISGASLSGRKLFVTGGGFGNGATILLNGEEQATRNDEQDPTGRLIGKRAGRKIAPGETVMLRVKNPDGKTSEGFHFTRTAN
jgi:hypothetical protein